MTHAVELLCDGKSSDAAREREVATIMLQAFELWKSRHLKYGPLNISMFGEVGCVVRGGDKLARLAEYHFKGRKEASDETVEDSWLDLVNYAVMGLMCKRGKW